MHGLGSLLPGTDPIQLGQWTSSQAADQPDRESLSAVGKEFESVLLSTLLKNMRSTVSENGLFAGDDSDTFGSMFDLFMSQHMASTNPLGIGQMIESFLANNQPKM